ncbi:unnamed protein product [Rhizophagus irregularis]|uniref:Protein kinase domain-containing protein n=1 Tax=Rhizophagus irregularis TaxID=588596 RepID=A0A915Z406_9GLOM|nr:unnamed protein product [Rhizophagus irregularis]
MSYNSKPESKILALKSLNNATAVEKIVHELQIQRDVDFHENIIRFLGITIENPNNSSKKYMLVMEYADGGTLREYLKKRFEKPKLSWNSKLKLARQLSSAVSCLHNEGTIHRDLHSNNVLIHKNNIKLADFGLSKKVEKSNKSQGLRETPIQDTPEEYEKIYTDCWEFEPDDRPTIYDVVDRLEAISSKTTKSWNSSPSSHNNSLPSSRNNSSPSSRNNSSHSPRNNSSLSSRNNSSQGFKEKGSKSKKDIVDGIAALPSKIYDKSDTFKAMYWYKKSGEQGNHEARESFYRLRSAPSKTLSVDSIDKFDDMSIFFPH